jgi:hypothetical protein
MCNASKYGKKFARQIWGVRFVFASDTNLIACFESDRGKCTCADVRAIPDCQTIAGKYRNPGNRSRQSQNRLYDGSRRNEKLQTLHSHLCGSELCLGVCSKHMPTNLFLFYTAPFCNLRHFRDVRVPDFVSDIHSGATRLWAVSFPTRVKDDDTNRYAKSTIQCRAP